MSKQRAAGLFTLHFEWQDKIQLNLKEGLIMAHAIRIF